MPRPPQTESISTPRLRAACSSGVPIGNRPRRPEGMKTTSASVRPGCSGTAAAALAPGPGTLVAFCRGLAELLNPARTVLVMAHGDIGPQDRGHFLRMKRVGDRRSHAGADEHGKKGGI